MSDKPKIRLELVIRARCAVEGCEWAQIHDTQKAAVIDVRRHLAEWHGEKRSRTARDRALLAIAGYLAGGDIGDQEDEAYWLDRARSYLEAIEVVGLTVVDR